MPSVWPLNSPLRTMCGPLTPPCLATCLHPPLPYVRGLCSHRVCAPVNAIGYKLYSRSTGNMTGLSSTIISNAYGDTDHSLLGSQILQLLSYLFGGVMSGTLINSRSTIRFGTHLYGVALILCAVFTCVGWLIIRTDSDSSHGGAGQCFLCMALGLQVRPQTRCHTHTPMVS